MEQNFQDIYELLEWIFVEEGKRVRKETAEKKNWQDRLHAVKSEAKRS